MNIMIPSHSKWLIPASLLVAPLALGIEGPEDDAQPPALAEQQAAKQAPGEQAEQQKSAFIGLVSGRIPELLSTHLGVRNGEGVLVRSVMPGGPADKAGIKANDVIVTVDAKSALSPAELGNIIRSYQPGEEVKIGLIQAGKGTELTVTLGERPDRLARMGPGNAEQMMRMEEGMPEDVAERLRDMIEGNMMQFQFDGEGIRPGAGFPDLQLDMKQMREEIEQLRQKQQDMLEQGVPLEFNANTTIRMKDAQGSVELSTKDGQSKLTVRDREGEVEWQGPWNNDEDKAKAPEAIRERAGGLKMDGGGFKLQMGR